MESTNIALEAWKEYWQTFVAANNLSVKDKDYRRIYRREYARFRWNNDTEYRERVNRQERERTKENPERGKAKYQKRKAEHREEFNAYAREYYRNRYENDPEFRERRRAIQRRHYQKRTGK